MDYKKAYKEALNKAKEIYCRNDATDGEKIIMEGIFPELKESEDELKWLTEFIREEAYYLSMDIRDNEDRIKLKNLQRSLAWLEKQDEQKPTWSEDERIRKGIIEYLEQSQFGEEHYQIDDDIVRGYIAWLEKQGDQKPNVYEWSEHQHKLLNYAISMTEDTEVKRFLESLRNAGSTTSGAWSEEDEIAIDDALWAIRQARTIAKDENDMGNLWYAERWLNSIKERMKGGEE